MIGPSSCCSYRLVLGRRVSWTLSPLERYSYWVRRSWRRVSPPNACTYFVPREQVRGLRERKREKRLADVLRKIHWIILACVLTLSYERGQKRAGGGKQAAAPEETNAADDECEKRRQYRPVETRSIQAPGTFTCRYHYRQKS